MANVDTKTLIPRVKVEHYGKLTEKEDLIKFFNAIYDCDFSESIKNALKFCLHIPLRAKPLSLIKWQNIDFKNRVITIPRENQKNKNTDLRNFKLPLSDEVINILQDQAKLSRAYEYVFINQRFTSHIHEDSPTHMLKKLGFKDPDNGKPITLHSFRGIFMTYALEHLQEHKVSTEAIGKVLDHLHGNTVTLSYSEKTTFFDELKIILSYWSNEILKLKDER
ncbi:tyrosine-type recombinase/integrase [Campylobacter ureolyticus]|uniref:tyrosine-type recombinase/integrase n=1 Tax=Campylobacter ureolyticus TaxID=827 RepID=UPI0004687D4B|nr:tyrosine-type recombinase/integrase [Campylobacter ureolyticus]STA71121.1 putative prophage integrase [Campylobacter ureolyticus]